LSCLVNRIILPVWAWVFDWDACLVLGIWKHASRQGMSDRIGMPCLVNRTILPGRVWVFDWDACLVMKTCFQAGYGCSIGILVLFWLFENMLPGRVWVIGLGCLVWLIEPSFQFWRGCSIGMLVLL
jgi:hypothetical protein